MSAVEELERSITAARAAGDQPTLARLQSEYRKLPTTRICEEPIRLIEERSYSATEASPAPVTGTLPSIVRLRPEAYATIVNWPHEQGLECAGIMVGYDNGQEVVVETIFAARGGDPVGERDRVVIDLGWFADVDARARRTGWRVVGDVHTHTHSEPKPSETDERGLRGAADHLQRHYIGVVVGRDPVRLAWGADSDLWLKPEINAFVAVNGDRSVRPIDLIVEGVG